VRDARRAGCLVLDGVAMLVAQAERQFEWWTGRRADPGVMLAAARRELAARRDPAPAEAAGAGVSGRAR
jgi:shikimate dehydrogenase